MRMDGSNSWNATGSGRGFGGFSPQRGGRRPPPILLAIFAFFFVFSIGSLVVISMSKTQASETSTLPTKVTSVEVPAPVEMEEVIVPIKNIEAGQAIDPSMVAKVSMPRSSIPLGSVRVAEEIDGTYARGNIVANQPIIKGFLTKERPTNAVVANIPEGYRAVTININATSGVEGWARAGAHVDIQWISAQTGQQAIMTIVQNAKILSAERKLDPNAEPGAPVPATATLLVNEFDAQKISLTASTGQLILHMRGTGDTEISATTTAPLTVSDLFNGAADPNAGALQGVAKVRKSDGSFEEWAVLQGNVTRKN